MISSSSSSPSPPHSAVPFFVLTFLLNWVPSQPYLTTFLKTGDHGFEESTLNSKIWPVSTYSMLMFSLPCGILASSYPSLTLFSGVVARVVLYVLLLTSSSVFSVQVVEVLYGLFVVVDGLVLVSSGCLGAPESSYPYIASGINVSREFALVLSSLTGQVYYEAVTDSDESKLVNLFKASLASCVLGLAWYAVMIRLPSSTTSCQTTLTSRLSSVHALFSAKRSLYLLTIVLCLSYASYLTAADYNFMLLTTFTSKNLGVVSTSLSLFGAIGAWAAGSYYKRYKTGIKEIAVVEIFSVLSFAYLGFVGRNYWVVVLTIVVPWSVYQTSRTFLTILISTAVGEEQCFLLPGVLGIGTLLGLAVASAVQLAVSVLTGRTGDYFRACMVLEAIAVGGIVVGFRREGKGEGGEDEEDKEVLVKNVV